MINTVNGANSKLCFDLPYLNKIQLMPPANEANNNRVPISECTNIDPGAALALSKTVTQKALELRSTWEEDVFGCNK